MALASAGAAAAQVDQELAAAYFAEARALCEREAGRVWGVSLCGPMVFADAATGTVATSQPAPSAERPRSFGYANSAQRWGDERWSTYVWSMLPNEPEPRARLLLHELFHRVQPELGLMTENRDNSHLDTLDGRLWLRLEWRALARALRTSGDQRALALADALAFRSQRRSLFPEAAANEQVDEIREGLAQYTGTVAAAPDARSALADAVAQLQAAEDQPTFVRTFAYTSGVALGVLLDAYAPGWPRTIKASDDLGEVLRAAADLEPTADPEQAARSYGFADLRAVEERRRREHQKRVDELRRLLVDGPVLIVPRGVEASFVTTGSTAIPGAGTTLASYRTHGVWGHLEAEIALMSPDGETFRVPAPPRLDGSELTGKGWTASLAAGWRVRPGERAGDFEVVRVDG